MPHLQDEPKPKKKKVMDPSTLREQLLAEHARRGEKIDESTLNEEVAAWAGMYGADTTAVGEAPARAAAPPSPVRPGGTPDVGDIASGVWEGVKGTPKGIWDMLKRLDAAVQDMSRVVSPFVGGEERSQALRELGEYGKEEVIGMVKPVVDLVGTPWRMAGKSPEEQEAILRESGTTVGALGAGAALGIGGARMLRRARGSKPGPDVPTPEEVTAPHEYRVSPAAEEAFQQTRAAGIAPEIVPSPSALDAIQLRSSPIRGIETAPEGPTLGPRPFTPGVFGGQAEQLRAVEGVSPGARPGGISGAPDLSGARGPLPEALPTNPLDVLLQALTEDPTLGPAMRRPPASALPESQIFLDALKADPTLVSALRPPEALRARYASEASVPSAPSPTGVPKRKLVPTRVRDEQGNIQVKMMEEPPAPKEVPAAKAGKFRRRPKRK